MSATAFPYRARIMACLPGNSSVELARFQRPIVSSDVRFWTGGMDPAWEIWGEYRTHECDLISPRPHLPDGTGAKQVKLALNGLEADHLRNQIGY